MGPVPPGRMRWVRSARPLKRWRYLGVYGSGLSLCLGAVQVGPAFQSFWAVWDREFGRLDERTRMGRRGVWLGTPGVPASCARVRVPGVRIDLRVTEDGEPVSVVSPHGRSYIWTRKAPARVTGVVRLGAREYQVCSRALVDDSAGYHARRTEWHWCAGAGTSPDGRAVTWNLVAGVHDQGPRSERTVWVDGRPGQVGPVRFGEGLDQVLGADGTRLRFVEEASRGRVDRVLGGLVRSDYRQPFGTFTGVLPGGTEVAEGFGVLERHLAYW